MEQKIYQPGKFSSQLKRGFYLIICFGVVILFLLPLLLMLAFNFNFKPFSFMPARQNSAVPRLSQLRLKI